MAGVYVHIPFCKSRCHYCDFYSTTLLSQRAAYVDAVLQEWKNRSSELNGTIIETLYFGGGTPSLLEVNDVERIIRAVQDVAEKSGVQQQEITMEANPGDLTIEKLYALRQAGVNRLSIGIQSFQDRLLRLISRRHTAQQAREAVQMARKAGFNNISIDLIYALPTQTMSEWQSDIDEAIQMRPEHISCYCLSYEDGTRLSRMLEEGEITETDEDISNLMYNRLCERLCQCGYEHYEVSNFALPEHSSRHNSSYWNNTPYVGLGAGAHSYDGQRRRWNRGDLRAYIENPESVVESEVLNDTDLYNERIMLRLRTYEGLEMSELHTDASEVVQHYCDKGLLFLKDNRVRATQEGLHILNRIIEDLMI